MKSDQLKNQVLDEYEQSIEDAIDENNIVEIPNMKERIKEYSDYAREHNLKRKISLRVKPDDLEDIKKKAAAHNIPYQTLICVVLHQYAKGKLKVVI